MGKSSLAALAGAVALSAGSIAKASLVVSAIREAGPTSNTSAILLYASGSGVNDSTIYTYDLSISDNTEAGIQMGNYQQITGLHSLQGYYTDVSGCQTAVSNSKDASGIPISYTWIGNGHGSVASNYLTIDFGGIAPTASTITTPTDGGNVVTPANVSLGVGLAYGKPAGAPGSTGTPAPSPYYGPLAGLTIFADSIPGIDATGADVNGGWAYSDGVVLGVVVVNSTDEVDITGNIGSGPYSTTDTYALNGVADYALSADYTTFSLDSTPAVPEPASLALLSVGGLMLARRRNRR